MAASVETELGLWVSTFREAVVPAKDYIPWVATAITLCHSLESSVWIAPGVESGADGVASATGALPALVDAPTS